MQERKKILVTGAAHRIGAELVKALALDGWHVCCITITVTMKPQLYVQN